MNFDFYNGNLDQITENVARLRKPGDTMAVASEAIKSANAQFAQEREAIFAKMGCHSGVNEIVSCGATNEMKAKTVNGVNIFAAFLGSLTEHRKPDPMEQKVAVQFEKSGFERG
jgi:hypothetical protein